MATVWIKRIYNFSNRNIRLFSNDGSWRPIIEGHRYEVDEPIEMAHGKVMTADHFFIPWSDWGRLRIENADTGNGSEWRVGPPPGEDFDALRGWDDTGKEVGNLPVGDRGGWWSSSCDLDLIFSPEEVKFVIVAQMNVKEIYLRDFARLADDVGKVVAIVMKLKALVGRERPPAVADFGKGLTPRRPPRAPKRKTRASAKARNSRTSKAQTKAQ